MAAAQDPEGRGVAAAGAAAVESLEEEERRGEEDEDHEEEKDPAAAKAPQTVATTSSSTLFVLGLPYDCSNEQLEEFFSEVGPVKGCFAVVDRSALPGPGGKVPNKGFGFVHYALADDAKRALVLLKKKEFLGKRPLKMEFAFRKAQDQSAKEAAKAALITPKKRKADELEPDTAGRAREGPAPPQDQKDPRGLEKSGVLRVTGLPAGVTNKQIYKRVRKSGSVTKLIRPAPAYADGSGEADDSVAHVVYAASDDVQKAQKHLDQHVFKGAKLAAVPLADAKRELRKARLIVRNVPWKMDETALRKMFSKHGGVVSVALPRKTPDGPLRGFAFVQMDTVESAEAAVKSLNATVHYGRPVAVDWAIAKGKFDEAEKFQDETRPSEETAACHGSEASSEGAPDGASPVVARAGESFNSGFDPIPGCVAVTAVKVDKRMAGGLPSASSKADESEEGEEEEGELNEVKTVTEEKVRQRKTNRLPTAKDGSTVFVRNLSFDSTEEDLAEKFSEFGHVLYAKIVTFPATGRSRGVAFVCFREASAAHECIQAYEVLVGVNDLAGRKERAAPRRSDKKNVPPRTTDKANVLPRKSVLLPEFPEEDQGPFFLDGRLLNVTLAVSKERAKQLEKASAKKKR